MSRRRKVPHCVAHWRAEHGWHYGHQGRWRQQKRFERKNGMSDPVYEAFNAGEAASLFDRAMPKRLQTNPYPPGRRHDEYERGRALDRTGSFGLPDMRGYGMPASPSGRV